MIRGRGVSFNLKLFTQFAHELRCESWVSVGDDFRGYSKPGEDVVEVQEGYSLCVDGLVTGEKDSHLSTSLVRDGQDGVISL